MSPAADTLRIRTRYQRMAAAVRVAERLRDSTQDQQVRDACSRIIVLLAAPNEIVRAREARLARLESAPTAASPKVTRETVERMKRDGYPGAGRSSL